MGVPAVNVPEHRCSQVAVTTPRSYEGCQSLRFLSQRNLPVPRESVQGGEQTCPRRDLRHNVARRRTGVGRPADELVQSTQVTANPQSTGRLRSEGHRVLPVGWLVGHQLRDDALSFRALKQRCAVSTPSIRQRSCRALEERGGILHQVNVHWRSTHGGRTSSSAKSAGSLRTSENSASSCVCARACCAGVAWSTSVLQAQLVLLTCECTALACKGSGVG